MRITLPKRTDNTYCYFARAARETAHNNAIKLLEARGLERNIDRNIEMYKEAIQVGD